jgi:hypothetical protein
LHAFHFQHTCTPRTHVHSCMAGTEGKVTTRLSLCRSAVCFLNFAALRLVLLQQSCAVSEKLDMSCTKLASRNPHGRIGPTHIHQVNHFFSSLCMHASVSLPFLLLPCFARAFTSHPAFRCLSTFFFVQNEARTTGEHRCSDNRRMCRWPNIEPSAQESPESDDKDGRQR